jgi:hypothetical protein
MTTTTNQNPQKIFGVNLWWTIPELAVTAEFVQSLLVKHGFSDKDMRAPSTRREVSRAVRSFQNRRTKNERRLAELASERGDQVVYGILDRDVNGENVEFTQKTTVKYDKNANTVSVSGTLANEVEVALEGYRGKVTDEDVRVFLRNLVRMTHGVAKRPTGGIYFVPASFVGVIDSAKAFLTELNSGANLYVERVVNDTEARQNVWVAVESDLDEQLDKILAAVENTEKRVGALKNQTDRVEGLCEMMKTYQDLLGEEAKHEEIAQKIEGVVQVISAKMVQLQQDKEEGKKTAASGYNVNRYDGYLAAVKQALAAGPLTAEEIEAKIDKNGVESPTRVKTHLHWRVVRGELKKNGDKYTIA